MNRICIVTPSFNQARFLGKTMSSVLNFEHMDRVDYVVMDGGSTDGSVEIIKSFEASLHHWQSGPDGGQYVAIAEGFKKSDASVMGWLNSDDVYLPWTLGSVLKIFDDLPEVDWITTKYPLTINAEDMPVLTMVHLGVEREGFQRGDCFPLGFPISGPFIQQEGTFWRRSLWEKAGGFLDTNLLLAADFELWHRFLALSEPAMVDFPLAGYRSHGLNRAAVMAQAYAHEAHSVLERGGPQPQRPEGFDMQRQMIKRLRATGMDLGNFQGIVVPAMRHIVFDEASGRYAVR